LNNIIERLKGLIRLQGSATYKSGRKGKQV